MYRQKQVRSPAPPESTGVTNDRIEKHTLQRARIATDATEAPAVPTDASAQPATTGI